VVTEPIGEQDTAGDLLARLAESGASLLVATLDGIEAGQLQPRPQSAGGVSYAPKMTPEDARVRWRAPAPAVGRQIRACTPAPGAWTMFGDTRLKLWPVRPGPPAGALGSSGPEVPGVPGSLAPGELWAGRAGVFAGTGTQPVELGAVQPPGKRRMTAAEWARGMHLPRTGTGQPSLVFS
jgi:methionyl-tRNA formyltransferase